MREQIHHTPLGDIHYWIRRTDADAPWLVFLPGLSADHMLFEKQLAYFCSKYNCFVWDAPAHALSRPFKLNFTMRDLAAHLHAIFEKEGVSRLILVGQSLGGYISQAYMDAYPGEASGFVSIDSCPMSRKYYSWWELALLKRTKWMYLSIPYGLLIRWGVWGTATTASRSSARWRTMDIGSWRRRWKKRMNASFPARQCSSAEKRTWLDRQSPTTAAGQKSMAIRCTGSPARGITPTRMHRKKSMC